MNIKSKPDQWVTLRSPGQAPRRVRLPHSTPEPYTPIIFIEPKPTQPIDDFVPLSRAEYVQIAVGGTVLTVALLAIGFTFGYGWGRGWGELLGLILARLSA